MTKFFVNSDGAYLGGFDGAQPPAGSIEVSEAPQSSRQVWDFQNNVWNDPEPSTDPADYDLSRRQIRTALVQAGKSATYVDDLISAMNEGTDKELAKIDWQDAPFYTWDHPLTVSLRESLSEWTEAEMAQMWIGAASLPR